MLLATRGLLQESILGWAVVEVQIKGEKELG